jgi:hypothetical protein
MAITKHGRINIVKYTEKYREITRNNGKPYRVSILLQDQKCKRSRKTEKSLGLGMGHTALSLVK